MAFRIYSPDLPNVLTSLNTVVTKIPIRTKMSTKRMAEQVLKDSDSIPPMVPVDTGALQGTGRVEATPEGHAVVYGGQDGVDYAAKVHDDLRPRKYKRRGSGPKFVESHIERRHDEWYEALSTDLQELVDSLIK